ncbi:helix-turn-helix transcriptional regulator [Tateyamaria sp. Alg231-49]|uniref:helix-turn-helix transcriptional regulator n=1 Tax=Tateyamaria sp. Alg231-49 TaxID=1922219 RepID=UPI000D55427E|nr:helix-turn-helix transcriptional regulator [Tateyamaria sp. Alg231-49]
MAKTAPLIRAANLLPLVRFMDMNRLETNSYLDAADLSYWFFLHPLNPLPTLNGIRLLRDLSRAQGPDVGIKIVQQSSVAELAFIGGVALGSQSPAEALHRISFAMPMHSTHENFLVTEDAGKTVIEHSFQFEIDPESYHAVQVLMLSMLQQLFRFTALSPPFFTHIEAVPHPEFGLSSMKEHFDAVITEAHRPVLRMSVDTAVANKPFVSPARDRSKTIDVSKIPPLAEDTSIGGSIRPIIDGMLHEGEPTVARVAFAAGMPVRTIQRRLNSEGTSFSEQIDIVRRRLAIDVLEAQDATIQDIAERLGYSSPSALTRAVRRLTGRSPSQLRG